MRKSNIPCCIGDKFGRLTIVADGGRDEKYHRQRWWCRCCCENPELILVFESQLKQNKTKSCGCLATETKSNIGKNNVTKSFAQWCIENNRQDILDLWDYDLNDVTPDEIAYTTKQDFYFICPNDNSHHPIHKIVNITKNNTYKMKCSVCSSFGYNLIQEYGDNALDLYWDYEKNTVDPFMILKNTNKNIWIKCQNNSNHLSYEITGNHFWSGRRCQYCAKKPGYINVEDSVVSKFPSIINVWSEKNNLSPEQYTPLSHSKVWWKCENGEHEDYYRSISESNKANFGCPECSKKNTVSSYEKIVKSYLEYLGYNVLTEFNCNLVPMNPLTQHKLPFDNEIPELKLIVEVHGEQHYYICPFTIRTAQNNNRTPKEELEYLQWKDEFKENYARQNGYNYLAISYKDIQSGEYKNQINETINHIL